MSSQPVPQPDQDYTDPNTGVSSHDTILFPSGSTLGLPKILPDNIRNSIAAKFHEVENQAGQAVGAMSESLGGPSSAKDVSGYLSRSKQALVHPIDSIKQIAKDTGNGLLSPSNPALLDAAKSSWAAGDKTAAATHMLNFLIPFVGSGSDRAGEDLKSGDYGKALGHVSAALLPLLMGNPEEAAITSPEEAATNAARQSTERVSAQSTAPVKSVIKPIVKPIVKPVTEAVLDSDAARSAAAYLRRIRATPEDIGHVEVGAGPSEATGYELDARGNVRSTGRPSGTSASVDPEAIRSYIRQQFGPDAADRVQLVDEGKSSPVTEADTKTAAQRHINELIKIAAKDSPSDVDVLHSIRQRLGLTGKISEEGAKTAGTPPTAEQLQTIERRMGTKLDYTKESGDVSTKHTVSITDPSGKPAGNVIAYENISEPGTWVVRGSSSTAGKGAGVRAYAKLLSSAEQSSTADTPVTVRGDASQTLQAKNAWSTLKQQGFDVQYANGRPSVTFRGRPQPRTPIGESFPLPQPADIRPASEAGMSFIRNANSSVKHALSNAEWAKHIIID